MRVASVRFQNLKSFVDTDVLALGPITLLVGRNNAGKSTFLRGIYSLQTGGRFAGTDVRLGVSEASLDFEFDDLAGRHWGMDASRDGLNASLSYVVRSDGGGTNRLLVRSGGNQNSVGEIAASAPNNLIFPFLARRKVEAFSETINSAQASAVGPTLQNLAAQVDSLMDDFHPAHGLFLELQEKVVNLPLSAIPSANGKRVGMRVDSNKSIYLEDMGDGIAQLIGLITNLCLAKDQIMLIEELENDVHPEALKLLLRVIEERRQDLQFVISTHNNIVLRALGSLDDTIIYEVESTTPKSAPRLPTSTIVRVGNGPDERTSLLRKLGYELSDLDLWDGWLILEESSAERIIRDHLIRWFAPGLSRVRPVAASGAADVEPSFSALHRLVLFTHLEAQYHGKIAVMVDGDAPGVEAVEALKKRFSSWPADAFVTFKEPAFEAYFPKQFKAKVKAALEVTDKQAKRSAKKELLAEVLDWIAGNEDDARTAFEESAAEVVGALREFEARLGPASKQI